MAEKMREQMVYKQLSAEMRDGLKSIYQQISTVSNDGEAAVADTDALFNEATTQLNEVVRATESAAMSIMEIMEKRLDVVREEGVRLERLREKLGNDEDLEYITTLNSQLEEDLTTVITTLSFQDITGQRIKKVVGALNAIERSVVELYVSSGLVMEGAEKDPAKDAGALKEEAQKAMEDFRENRKVTSTLKGPSKDGVSQNAIDDMLAQLGL